MKEKNSLGELRRSAGMTQNDLAMVSGVKISTIQKLESGANSILGARVSIVMALAKALGVTVEVLVGE